MPGGTVHRTLSDAAVSGTRYADPAEALAAGDVEGLLEFHRATFGGFRLKLDGDDQDGDDNDDGAADDDDQDDDGDDDDGDDGDDGDDEDAKLRQARDDAAKRRRQAREARTKAKAEAERADKAERELARLRKAAGGKDSDDDGDDNADDRRDNDERERRDRERIAELELRDVVRDVAPTVKADAAELLDSRKFLESVQGLDPEDDDYRDDVADAIRQAVKSNKRLRAGGSGRSGSEFTGGSGERGKRPKGLADAIGRRYAG